MWYNQKVYFNYQQHISLKCNISRTFEQFSLCHTRVCLHRKAARLHAIYCISDAKQFGKSRFLSRQGKNLQEYEVISKIFNEAEAGRYLSKPHGLLVIKIYKNTPHISFQRRVEFVLVSLCKPFVLFCVITGCFIPGITVKMPYHPDIIHCITGSYYLLMVFSILNSAE